MSSDLPRGVDRRQFITLGVGAFVVASLPTATLIRGRRPVLVRRTMPVMGTIAEFAVLHRDVRMANLAIDSAATELRRVEALMTRFTPTSDIGRANAAGARRAVPVNAETASVVRDALAWAEVSDGAFDPAIGGAVALWDVTRRHAPPPEHDVRAFAGRHLYRHVRVEVRGARAALAFEEPAVKLDLGGIAKGHGVDCAADVLRRWGVTSALVNVGGDLVAIGSAADGDPWRIGIQDPADERGLIGTVDVADAAVATSGSYQQYFRHRGHRYHHLLDPATGAPRVTPVQSLTVQARCCRDADAAATALYGMNGEHAAAVLSVRSPGAFVVRTA